MFCTQQKKKRRKKKSLRKIMGSTAKQYSPVKFFGTTFLSRKVVRFYFSYYTSKYPFSTSRVFFTPSLWLRS